MHKISVDIGQNKFKVDSLDSYVTCLEEAVEYKCLKKAALRQDNFWV